MKKYALNRKPIQRLKSLPLASNHKARARNFYVPSVSPGTYTIKMQWVVAGVNGISAGTNSVAYRTLSAIVLSLDTKPR